MRRYRMRIHTDKRITMNNDILCANCGCIGHIYKACNSPVCSFGIICFRITYDVATSSLVPQYVMVQRKDSLCYVEFIRAKYVPQNRKYVTKLFASMTPDERSRIRNAKDFDELWFNFWHIDACKSYMKEYQQAKHQYNMLKKGFSMRCADMGDVIQFSLDYVLDNTKAEYPETEWGWPKGRRNINEPDLKCALREFSEETGMDTTDVSVLTNMKPFEEVFTGCNNVRYRHVYYLALQTTQVTPEMTNKQIAIQAQEIRKVKWCDYDTVLSNIRTHNVERRELFKRTHRMVTNNFLNNIIVNPLVEF
jgi:ADP-ribose pyrophosphatase YjhB (NUDIX family)